MRKTLSERTPSSITKEDKTHIFYCEKNEKNGWYVIKQVKNNKWITIDVEKIWNVEKVKTFLDALQNEKIEKMDFDFDWFVFPEIDWKEVLNGNECSWIFSLVWAKFCGYADFSGIKFQKGVHFREVHFFSWVSFLSADFLWDVTFERVVFSQSVDFIFVKFQWNVKFWYTKFQWEVEFYKTIFYRDTLFDNVIFIDWVFREVQFSREWLTIFDNNIEDPAFWFKYPVSVLSLIDIVFNVNCTFRRYDFSEIIFHNSQIDKIVFQECEFKKINWRKVLADESNNKMFTQVENLYCQLKSNFEDKKSWQLAGDFHIGEMEMRLKWLWQKWDYLEFIILRLYKLISLYWERIWRPLLWMIFVIIGASSMLWYLWPIKIGINEYLTSFWESLLTVFRTFILQKEDWFSESPVRIKVIITFVQLTSLILSPLLILAIRRKTKR